MKCLLPHPVLLLAKSGCFPFLERLRRLIVNACIRERLGKSASEVRKEEGVIQVSLGTLAQEFECGDIFVHISFLHFQLFELLLCADIFCVVNKGAFEPSFEDLPSVTILGLQNFHLPCHCHCPRPPCSISPPRRSPP